LDVDGWAKKTFGTLKSHSPPKIVNPKKVTSKKRQKKVTPDKVNAPRAAPRAKMTFELRASPTREDTSEALVMGRSDCSEVIPKEKRRRWSLKAGLKPPQERGVDVTPPQERGVDESGNTEEDRMEFSLPVAATECESRALRVESEDDFIPDVQGTTTEVEGRRNETIEGRKSGDEDALKNKSLSVTGCRDVVEFQGNDQVDGAAHWQALAVATWKFTMAEQSCNEAEAALTVSRGRVSALKQSLEIAREELQELRNAAVRLNTGRQKTVKSPRSKRQRQV